MPLLPDRWPEHANYADEGPMQHQPVQHITNPSDAQADKDTPLATLLPDRWPPPWQANYAEG